MTEFICNIEKIKTRIENDVLNKSRKRGGPESLSTVDGDTWINRFISTIASELYGKLFSPLSRDLTDPFINGIVLNEPEIIYNVEFPATFDINTVTAITQALEDTIVSYAVYKWLKDLSVEGWEIDEADHLEKYGNLRNLITNRINLKRTYKYF